jgi:hypothetical protein
LLHNFYHKTSQTVFIQPALAVSWHVDRLVSVNVDKMIGNYSDPLTKGSPGTENPARL